MIKRILSLIAAGMLLFNAACAASESQFRPEILAEIDLAKLICGKGGGVVIGDEYTLEELSQMLTSVREDGYMTADCPFDAVLELHLADGQKISLEIATDTCCVYRVDGWDYSYGRHVVSGDESNPDNEMLFNLFSMDTKGNFAEHHRAANAWTFGRAPLYRSPGDAEPIAVLPPAMRVLWHSTTADYAFGYIEAVLNGEYVQGYAPWLNLQAYNTGIEDELAIVYLQTELGWTKEELDEYQMYVPMTAQRNQFCCVTILSRLHPQWRYDVWVDYLTHGGLHDIQASFTGAFSADERAIRETLRSGTLNSAEAVRIYFQECYGPQESWSPALQEWVESECQRTE